MEKQPAGREGFINTYDAAEMIGISPATLRVWRVKHKGPKYYKFSNMVFYKREDVEEWIRKKYTLVDPEKA